MGIRYCCTAAAAALAILGVGSPSAGAQMIDPPVPYLSFADSPFLDPLFPSSFAYFHLDDFETDTRTPGYSVNAGQRIGASDKTDSVDWDGPGNFNPSTGQINPATSLIPPGSLDGSGIEGSSWFSADQTKSFTFTFDAAVLGGLPTHAGIVWTDVGNVEPGGAGPMGINVATFEAFGPGATGSIGILENVVVGTFTVTGETDEDLFFGIVHTGGISHITISMLTSRDWEVDHLQYGALAPIPEPEQWLLMALGLGALGLRLRKGPERV